MIFADLTSDLDVNYFTGLRNIDAFRLVFDYLSEKGKSNSNALLERTFEHFNRPHIPSESQKLKSWIFNNGTRIFINTDVTTIGTAQW